MPMKVSNSNGVNSNDNYPNTFNIGEQFQTPTE